MYHRILPKSDPRYSREEPGMVVTPETLEMHLQILRRHFDIVPLSEWLDRRHSGQALPAKSCAITFDDGWLDNYEYAFPILKRHQVPATLFAVSHMIGTSDSFWPNRVAKLLERPRKELESIPWLAPHLPPEDFSPDAESASAQETASRVIGSLKTFSDDRIHSWLDSVAPEAADERAMMNWDELREMATSGFVEIGSHTCHHYRLRTDLPPDIIERELAESKKILGEELKQAPRLFCYPNGDVCEQALRQVPEFYQAAVTTKRGINVASELNSFQLLRLGIHQDRCDTEAKFYSRLANWY
ncbi:polysaccharide deacetylase family protein [Proteobacteria bacterium 005FR1]|nr:polysaccharide deacetylase family protein [Proteobacteria bacterium 005FR1]